MTHVLNAGWIAIHAFAVILRVGTCHGGMEYQSFRFVHSTGINVYGVGQIIHHINDVKFV